MNLKSDFTRLEHLGPEYRQTSTKKRAKRFSTLVENADNREKLVEFTDVEVGEKNKVKATLVVSPVFFSLEKKKFLYIWRVKLTFSALHLNVASKSEGKKNKRYFSLRCEKTFLTVCGFAQKKEKKSKTVKKDLSNNFNQRTKVTYLCTFQLTSPVRTT